MTVSKFSMDDTDLNEVFKVITALESIPAPVLDRWVAVMERVKIQKIVSLEFIIALGIVRTVIDKMNKDHHESR